VTAVAYAEIDSPAGLLLAATTDRGLVRLALTGEPRQRVLMELRSRLGAEPVQDSEALAPLASELDEYFAAARREFTIPLDRSLTSGFDRRACEELSAIPYGSTVTYAELARRAGRPGAARAAGHACATNPIAIVVPCHRVLGSDGSLRGYGGGLELKRSLLQLEGALLV
jgi:methylated-DNA-[protein]-cysteine S-methyltransferase